MSERFWDFFSTRSLVLYFQLSRLFHQHGFMIVLTLLGDELKLKSEKCDAAYIRSFKKCSADPMQFIDLFIRHMKVCRLAYAKETSAHYRISSYLRDVIRESGNYRLEKDSYIAR